MQKSIVIFAATLVLPTIVGIAWMLTPSPLLLPEDAPRDRIPDAASPAARSHRVSQAYGTTVNAATISRPGIARPADAYFLETTPDPSPTFRAELPAAPARSISRRYTLTTQSNAATLANALQNQPPLQRDERIRVLPAEAASAENKPIVGTDAVVLILDAALHDPAAWIEDAKLGSTTQSDVNARIADEFITEVAAAAKQPQTTGKSLDATWQSARAKANWDYQKFFGSEAANRAGMDAGRAAVAK